MTATMISGPRSTAPKRLVGSVLFLLGLTLMAVSAFVSSWPDMESSVFDSSTTLMANRRLGSLRCPVVVTVDEAATVSVGMSNRSERPRSFLLRTRISQGFVSLWRQDSREVRIEPGDRADLSWPVTAKDAAYGRLILVRVLAMASADTPASQASCGILVVGLSGVRGGVLFAALVAASVALMASGGALWSNGRRPLTGRSRRTATTIGSVAAILVLALVFGLLGWWLASHLMLILAALVPIAALERMSDA